MLLYEPQARDISITILPGWHIGEVENHLKTKFRDRVDELNLVDMNSQLVLDFRAQYPFLGYSDSLEGFLYPDTYRIYPDATLRDMVEVMLQRFDEKIYSEYANETGDMDFYDTLILASILEEEEKSTENKPTVAGILKKRLDE